MKTTRFSTRFLLGALASAAVFFCAAAQAAYPERPITLIVPWGAGGGTDATARIIAALMEKELKQPINVVNRTGGSGVVGHQAIASSPADGYTIGLITVEIAMMHADPSALYPKVPTLKKELGSNWTMAAWRVIAAPKGMPADLQARLVAILKKVHDSKEFRDFMAQRGYGVVWAGPQDAVKFMAKSDADLGAVMKSVGIAK